MILSRRNFIKFGLLGSLGLGASAIALHKENTADFEFVERTLPLDRLPAEFNGYRIALLGDFHYGAYFERAWLAHIFDVLRNSRIDLLLLCGDYIWIHDAWVESAFPDTRNPAFTRKIAKGKVLAALILSELGQALQTLQIKDGCFAVLGNHDRWISASLCSSELEKSGIKVITNEFARIQRGPAALDLVGLDDYWTGFPALPANLPELSEKSLRIALTHNPDLLSHFLTSASFKFDLGLAGHTHGGQIRYPGLPVPYYNIWDTRLGEGHRKSATGLAFIARDTTPQLLRRWNWRGSGIWQSCCEFIRGEDLLLRWRCESIDIG